MPEPTGSPDDLVWLSRLIRRSPLLPDATLRSRWTQLLPWLDTSARYELAASLRATEIAIDTLEQAAEGDLHT